MKFAALALQAFTLTGLWSLGSAKAPLRGSRVGGPEDASAALSKEEHLVELAKAVTVLQDAGFDVNNLDWGRKPEPEEQLVGSDITVIISGIDADSISASEDMFLEDALQFSFNQVNKGGDMAVNAVRIYSTESFGGTNSSNLDSNLGRNPTGRRWWGWAATTDFRCRMCRDERFLGSGSVGTDTPMVIAWENKLEQVLKTSGYDTFTTITDVDIRVSAGIVDAFAAAAANAMNSVLAEA